MHKLCTKPCQFTKGKTEETLSRLTQQYLINADNQDYHLLNIVITNKSLPETKQWKLRTKDKFKDFENITIDILSSKSSDYKNIDSYIVNILSANSKNDYPNILIVCFHGKRVNDDLIKLFNFFNGNTMVHLNTVFKCELSLDEPDANLGITKKFLKSIKSFIDNELIVGITYITATPVADFWKILGDCGIKTLLNITHNSQNIFEDDFENYRDIKEHVIIENNNDTNNPLYYIIDCFAKRIINNNERNIIFAPAHICVQKDNVGSHMEIVNYFIEKNYCVFLQNGKFKGFIYPDGLRVDIKDFNLEHDIRGELRETLKKWNELNPTISLAITGHLLNERGITFNTIGFNFTHAILSNYFLKVLKRLIQIAGRTNGGKEYVNPIIIICTKTIKDTIYEWNENFEKICSLNPEFFNKTDFEKSNVAIPVKMVFNDLNLLQEIFDKRENITRYKVLIHNLITNGIENGKITIFDKNNIKKFDITSRTIKECRVYKLGDCISSRRFKQFNKCFENFKTSSQTCSENQYNIDFAKDQYVDDDFINEINTAWITYKC
jgi:hypothetical protein